MIKTGNRNFWIAQIIGWGTFSLINLLIQLAVQHPLWPSIINSLVVFISGIVSTTSYRYILIKRKTFFPKFSIVLRYIIASTIVLSLVFLMIVAILTFILHDQNLPTLQELLSNAFIFGILMLIWNSLYFMIHYINSWNQIQTEKWQLEASIKEAQLGNLKAQINPHFMFNAINNIKSLISHDPDKAKEMLVNFSDMFRYSLLKNDKSMVKVEEEIEMVKNYLELLEIQFEEKLTYELSVAPQTEEQLIPPMMIQILVENAIKHGISQLEEGGKVRINVSDDADHLKITVTNPGNLKSTHNLEGKLGVGLDNIKKRLTLLYNEKANFEIKEIGNQVQATITLPYKESL